MGSPRGGKMTIEKQKDKIAEALGWSVIQEVDQVPGQKVSIWANIDDPAGAMYTSHEVLNSLKPTELGSIKRKLLNNPQRQQAYWCQLMDVFARRHGMRDAAQVVVEATPEDELEALVRTLGKWE